MLHLIPITPLSRLQIAVIGILSCLYVNGQFTKAIYEDVEGKSSIVAPTGFFGLNIKDQSISLQYFYKKSARNSVWDAQGNVLKKSKRNSWFAGAGVKGKAENDILNLFQEGNFTPDIGGNFLIGKCNVFGDALELQGDGTFKDTEDEWMVEDWLSLRGTLNTANYKIADTSLAFPNEVRKEQFRGYTIDLAYNFNVLGNWIFGVSVGVQQSNNIDFLETRVVSEKITTKDTSGKYSRDYRKDVTAFFGGYNEFIQYPIKLDASRVFANDSGISISVNHYTRINLRDGKPVLKTGVGVYMYPKRNNSKATAGIFIENYDLTNAVSDEKLFEKRITIGLTFKYLITGFK